MDDDWEVNSMMELDHYQDIARAAFGDMLYDSNRVNTYKSIYLMCLHICIFYLFFIESIVLQGVEKRNY